MDPIVNTGIAAFLTRIAHITGEVFSGDGKKLAVDASQQGKCSVGILRPGESSLKDYLFSGQYFYFSLPQVFSGVVENGTREQTRFYIVAIHRAGVDDQRAEIGALKSLLVDLR